MTYEPIIHNHLFAQLKQRYVSCVTFINACAFAVPIYMCVWRHSLTIRCLGKQAAEIIMRKEKRGSQYGLRVRALIHDECATKKFKCVHMRIDRILIAAHIDILAQNPNFEEQ